MNLPYNIQLLPGVQQLANGKKFKLGRYPSGKTVMVPYEEEGAPQAQMIPVPVEPKPEPKRKVITTTAADGSKIPVRFTPKRLHVVSLRRRGQKQVITETAYNGQNGLAALIDSNLCRFDGKDWHPLFPSLDDFHMQYHIDEEVK